MKRYMPLLLLLLTSSASAFTVDAETKVKFELLRSRNSLRIFDNPGIIARNMPGITAAEAIGNDLYRWKVRISVPMGKDREGEYVVRKTVVNDSVTIYESNDRGAPDYILCRIRVLPSGESKTNVEIDMRLRSVRESASDFHWLAPILGQSFLSARMKDTLDDMLAAFVENTRKEIHGDK